MDVANTPELLRQHGDFVRKLARALLADPTQAEDVAQEALTRLVIRPPRDASRPEAWLTTVVRRLAANTRRREARRRQHEEQAAPAEPVPSPLEASVQAELVRRVVAAVLELEPAQRDTILSRYFRGLTVLELAAESATSADTVRTRERRALEKLRTKLDRGFGERAAWAIGLGRLAERSLGPAPEAAAAGAGGGSAVAWFGVAAGLALATTAAVLWLSDSGEPSARMGATQESSALADALADAQAVAAGTTAEPRPSVAAPIPIGARVSVAPGRAQSTGSGSGDERDSSSALVAALAEIRGTLLLEDGAPAAHVPWSIIGWEGNAERVLAHGLPEDWVDPQGETAADGSFSARFAPPKAFQFALDAKAAGHAPASWRWSEIEAGRVLDLGTVTLARGATVTGRLLDGVGAPILGQEWTVHLDSRGLGQREGRDDVLVSAELDPATGEFTAVDVMPGSNELSAYHRGASIRGPRVVAVADAVVTADLVYAGPDVSRRITVVPSCRPLHVLGHPDDAHIRLLAPDGSTRVATKVEGSSGSFAFDDLAPGSYAVTIDDPRFRPWSQVGVLPGSVVQAELEPCSEVTVAAVDAAGQPLALDSLTVTLQEASFPVEILVHDGSAPFAGRVRLAPGSYTLHGRAGELECEADVLGLGFDETRALTLTFGAGPMLRGRVTDASGAALGGVQVLLLQPARVDDALSSPILPPRSSTGDPELYRKQLGADVSDADGSFALRLAHGGDLVVYAELPHGLRTNTPVLSLADGESRAGIELRLPPAASVSGTVRAPGGASCAGLRLWIGPVLGTRAGFRQLLALDETARTLGADGAFAFDDLPAGTMQALLLLPEEAHPTVSSMGGTWNRIELERFELAAGQALVRELAATLPGTFTLEVRVNGAPAAGVSFALEHPYATPNRASLQAILDGRGAYGPAQLFPGPWSVRVNAGGVAPVPLAVQAGGEAHTVVDVLVSTGSLRILDAAGAALAGRSLSVFPTFPTPDAGPAIACARAMTDLQGLVAFALEPGVYRLRLDAAAAHPLPILGPGEATVPFTWTAQGPQASEIRF